MKYCSRCKDEKPLIDFYKRRGKEGGSSYCKLCTNDQTIKRQRIFKDKCVEYKGGECEECKYKAYVGALEFHHVDPTTKKFSLATRRLTSFSEEIKQELDKCMILCSNCHREKHAKIKGLL